MDSKTQAAHFVFGIANKKISVLEKRIKDLEICLSDMVDALEPVKHNKNITFEGFHSYALANAKRALANTRLQADDAICSACDEPMKYHVGGAKRGLCKNRIAAKA